MESSPASAGVGRAVRDIVELLAKVAALRGDVSRGEDIQALADLCLERFGVPHIVINNAGVVRGNKYFWESDPERDTKFTMDVNALAPMYVAREFLPAMVAGDGDCRVLNLASAARYPSFAAELTAATGRVCARSSRRMSSRRSGSAD
mgnify:CR=1 FL=1